MGRALQGFTSNMASRHMVVERGDPFKENIKNAWNWELWPSEKVREEEGKEERVGLHIRKIAEPGIAYCTVCDHMISYTEERMRSPLTDLISLTE